MTRDEITAHKAASTRELKMLRKNAEYNKANAVRHYRTIALNGHPTMSREEGRRRWADALATVRSQYRAIRVQLARRAELNSMVAEDE